MSIRLGPVTVTGEPTVGTLRNSGPQPAVQTASGHKWALDGARLRPRFREPDYTMEISIERIA